MGCALNKDKHLIGHTISKLWDADWFYDRIDKKTNKQDVFCLQSREEVSVKNDSTDKRCKEAESEHEWMNSQDANELRSQWHTRESKEDKEIRPKTRRKMMRPKGEEAKEHKEKFQKQYNEHIQDERCKFRRRVQETIRTRHKEQTHELPEDADFIEQTFEGEVCNIHASIPLELALERKPTLPKMKDEGCDLRSAQEKDPQFGPLIEALEDKLNEDLPQIQKHCPESPHSEIINFEILDPAIHPSSSPNAEFSNPEIPVPELPN